MKHSRIVLAFIGMLLICTAVQAQKPGRRYNYWSVGGFVGASAYNGDLTASNSGKGGFPKDQLASLKFLHFAIGAAAQYNFHPHLAARFTLNYGNLSGDDAKSSNNAIKERNLNFKSILIEGSGQLVYNFLRTSRGYQYRPLLNPYVFAGISAFYFDPKTLNATPAFVNKATGVNLPAVAAGTSLRSARTEGQSTAYAPYSFAIPFGVGLKYRIAPRWDVGLELGLRRTFTGYLDDVAGKTSNTAHSTYYPTLAQLGDDPTRLALSDRRTTSDRGTPDDRRGGGKAKDWYGFGGVTIMYILKSGESCPKPYKAKRHHKFLIFG